MSGNGCGIHRVAEETNALAVLKHIPKNSETIPIRKWITGDRASDAMTVEKFVTGLLWSDHAVAIGGCLPGEEQGWAYFVDHCGDLRMWAPGTEIRPPAKSRDELADDLDNDQIRLVAMLTEDQPGPLQSVGKKIVADGGQIEFSREELACMVAAECDNLARRWWRHRESMLDALEHDPFWQEPFNWVEKSRARVRACGHVLSRILKRYDVGESVPVMELLEWAGDRERSMTEQDYPELARGYSRAMSMIRSVTGAGFPNSVQDGDVVMTDGGFSENVTILDIWHRRANENIDQWGLQNPAVLLLALQEELGELTKAYLEATYEGGEKELVREEMHDVGALLFQLHWALNESLGAFEEVCPQR